MNRKLLKKSAKKNFKRHYLLFVLLCLFAAFIGTEFTNSLSFTRMESTDYSQKIVSKDLEIDDKVTKKINEVDNNRQKVKNKEKEISNKYFVHKKGVFSKIINTYNSNAIFVNVYNSVNSIITTKKIANEILIVITILLILSIYFLFSNVYKVIIRRFILEGRIYEKVPLQRLNYLLSVKKWLKVTKTMLINTLFYIFWCFTIIGAIIKRYSYFLVPFIVAENPNINSIDAITLSRKMMNNHKWECFKLEFSFILWNILGTFTLGLSNVFFSNPYKLATYSEFYVKLREETYKKNIKNIELLNDKYLYEKPTDNDIKETYKDVIKELKEKEESINLVGVKGFVAKNFGIILGSKEMCQKLNKKQNKKLKRNLYKNTINKKTYPTRLFPINYKLKRKMESNNSLRFYSISSIIAMFFIFSFVGWLWEVSLHLVRDGVFVNRGALYGPWLPIYGSGAVLILTLLYRFRYKPSVQFITIIILCGLVEYCTSFYLEINYHKRWWDYSGYFLNLNGRICAEGLLTFGLGGLACVYFVAPLIDDFLNKINKHIIYIILLVLISSFVVDKIITIDHPNTGKGISKSTNIS